MGSSRIAGSFGVSEQRRSPLGDISNFRPRATRNPEMTDVFNYPDGSKTDIAGVIMYVGPLDNETYFPLGMREVVVLDASYRIVFVRLFDKIVEQYMEQLFFSEANAGCVVATSLECDQNSRSLLSTETTTLKFQFQCCLSCHQLDMLKDVRQYVRLNASCRDTVKNVVLLRRDAIEQDKEDIIDDPPTKKLMIADSSRTTQASSVKDFFSYLRDGANDHTMIMPAKKKGKGKITPVNGPVRLAMLHTDK